MDQEEIKHEAKRLEQMAIEGQESTLAQELHGLDPADRRAVAKQIQKDAEKDTSGFLPDMEFTKGGDLKSIVEVDRVGIDNHRAVIRNDFDPATGKLKSWDMKGSDGSTGHAEYDSVTGKQKFYDEKDADGTTEHVEYNSTTGYPKSKDLHEFVEVEFPFFPDLKLGYFIDQHRDYDAAGRVTLIDMKGPDGDTNYREENTYDPTTGKRITENVINDDGSTKHTTYDPATGKEKVVYEKDKDGNTTFHAEYK